ncbi:MAG: type I restriction enzyme HsdR N-terminal domain-containing protein [Tepidisphaerales bacterium]
MYVSLEDTIKDIVKRLREGAFRNEQSISTGIVLKLLNQLGWDIFDNRIVWPEYSTGEGRADYALCVPPEKPALLIEVKQPGSAEEGVRQVLSYAFHVGAPFAVLTDGKTWSFYLPAEQGQYEDRRVYKLDLIERTPSESADLLRRFLAFERVKSGEARKDAIEAYRSRSRRQESRRALAEAWNELLSDTDAQLVELLSRLVETKVGFPPEEEDVENFLRTQAAPSSSTSLRASGQFSVKPQQIASPTSSDVGAGTLESRASTSVVSERLSEGSSSRSGRLRIKDEVFEYRTAIEGLKLFLQKMAARDPTFLERCAAHPDNSGHRRRYIARSPEQLFPNRPDLRDNSDRIAEGWYLNTNMNNVSKRRVLRFAGEVAGLKLGIDFDVDF